MEPKCLRCNDELSRYDPAPYCSDCQPYNTADLERDANDEAREFCDEEEI